MNASTKKNQKLRCAIYTRKSTSEGLDAEITSLDVQRQAGEAYIQSQAQEGWVCLPQRYDDGGFSGADMERPALKRLMQDIEAGKVDLILVYKVDRFSRSLVDFAQLISVFDRQGVAFVAVTQRFCTSDSMGRLTLNILLSFAQFERELIAERTRDKMAAARRSGRWAGGTPPMGYDPVEGQLVVNPEEAQRVRAIFELYVETGSLSRCIRELNRRRWRTKSWTTRKGRQRGGRPFRKNSLHNLLTSVTYLGKVRHKGTVYDGRQEAIVEKTLFERVQQRLAQGRRRRRHAVGNRRQEALLEGRLCCSGCRSPMKATYTTKGARRYRYYACRKSPHDGNDSCPGTWLPAAEIERTVIKAALGGAEEAAALSPSEQAGQVRGLVERVEYDEASGRLTIDWEETCGRETLIRQVHFRTTGHGRKQLCEEAPTAEKSRAEPIPRLARLMALALRLEGLVRNGQVTDYAELARLGHVSRARVSQILSLVLLAPDIQETLLFLPANTNGGTALTERHLRPIAAEPDWSLQRQLWQQLPFPTHQSRAEARRGDHRSTGTRRCPASRSDAATDPAGSPPSDRAADC
jgi:site-specific DNA recombinase